MILHWICNRIMSVLHITLLQIPNIFSPLILSHCPFVLCFNIVKFGNFLNVNFLISLIILSVNWKFCWIVILRGLSFKSFSFQFILIDKFALTILLINQAFLYKVISFLYLFLKIVKHSILNRHRLTNFSISLIFLVFSIYLAD